MLCFLPGPQVTCIFFVVPFHLIGTVPIPRWHAPSYLPGCKALFALTKPQMFLFTPLPQFVRGHLEVWSYQPGCLQALPSLQSSAYFISIFSFPSSKQLRRIPNTKPKPCTTSPHTTSSFASGPSPTGVFIIPYIFYSSKCKSWMAETVYMHRAPNNGRCYSTVTARDLLQKSQDTHTALSQFYFLFSRLWRDGGSPAVQNFPFIQDQELSHLIKEKFIQMLHLTTTSFLSQLSSCKTVPLCPFWSVLCPGWQWPSIWADHRHTRPRSWEHHRGNSFWLLLWAMGDLSTVLSMVLIVADGAIGLKIIQNKTGISNWDQSVKPTEHSLGCSWSQLSTSHLKCTSKGRASEGGGKEAR